MKTTTNNTTYVIVSTEDKSIYETTDYDKFYETVELIQNSESLKGFWVATRLDDYNVSIYHEYSKNGSHRAVIEDIECIQYNESNRKSIMQLMDLKISIDTLAIVQVIPNSEERESILMGGETTVKCKVISHTIDSDIGVVYEYKLSDLEDFEEQDFSEWEV